MKSLSKNSLYNVIYKCLGVLFPLVTSAYVSRVLMAEGLGKVASAQNVAAYFSVIAALGIPTYGIKKIAEQKTKNDRDKCFSELFIINALSTLVCSSIYYLMINVVPFFQEKIPLLYVTGLSIILNIFNVDWFYQGEEEYRYIMLRSLLVKVISLVSIFFFVKKSEDYLIYALIQTMGTAFNYVFNILHLRHNVSFHTKGLSLKRHLRPVFILLASTIAIEVYTMADTTMLSVMCNDTVVGYYSVSTKALNIVKMLVSSVCAVFFPRLSYYYSNETMTNFIDLIKKGFKIILGLACPAIVLLLFLGDYLVLFLFGPNYSEAAITLRILSISVLSVSLSGFIGAQVLVTIGKEQIVFYSTVAGALVNIVLNSFLIPIYANNGAALASAITELTVTIIQYIYLKKYIRVFQIDRKDLRVLLLQCLTMIGAIFTIRILFSSLFIALFVAGGVASTLYLITGIILKSDFVMMIINKIPLLNRINTGG